MRFISIFLASFWVLSAAWAQVYEWKAEGNPVVRHKYTADPATLVYKDTLWIFAGEDFEGNQQRTHMEEAPWVHKRGDKYYLSYASGFPERIAYAMADSIEGPWVYQGILNEWAGNSSSNHQAIQEYKGRWYFFYHNGVLKGGTSCSRSVCADYLYYNADGTMRRVQMTSEGVLPVVK